MKNPILLFLVLGISLCFLSASCEGDKLCFTNTGTLKYENKSLYTVQRIILNGTNYGSIDPGETEEIELTEGTYEFSTPGLSGGDGCASISIIYIKPCETVGRSCSY